MKNTYKNSNKYYEIIIDINDNTYMTRYGSINN
jgi:predicted DNA-binding WGR domain protein